MIDFSSFLELMTKKMSEKDIKSELLKAFEYVVSFLAFFLYK